MGAQVQLLTQQVWLLFVGRHSCVKNDLTHARRLVLLDEVALDAARALAAGGADGTDGLAVSPPSEDGPRDAEDACCSPDLAEPLLFMPLWHPGCRVALCNGRYSSFLRMNAPTVATFFLGARERAELAPSDPSKSLTKMPRSFFGMPDMHCLHAPGSLAGGVV